MFCAAALAFFAPSAAQKNKNSDLITLIPVTDLGIKQVRKTSNLKLKATNVNCDNPQTFEFSFEGGAWLRQPPSTTIAGLGKGQSGTLNAQLDFTNTPPGIYYGHISSRCTTCGWYIMTACVESGEDTVIRVTVTDPAIDEQGTNLRDPGNPFANLVAFAPPQIALVPQLNDEDLKFLTEKGKRKLIKARNNVKAAEARGRQAREDARLARKKKNDCDREAARLKAESDAAKRKADIAKQDAANAAGAAKAAAKELSDFEKDKKKADGVLKRAEDGVRAQERYLVQVTQSDGAGSPREQNARKFLKNAQDKREAARKAAQDVRDSHDARKAQADKTKKDADDAKKAADKAKADAKAAKAKADAKARECKGLDKPIKDADKAVEDAKKNAKHHVGIANYEEGEAKKDAAKAKAKAVKAAAVKAAKDLDEAIENQRKKCKFNEKQWDEKMRRMTAALNALKQIGYFKASDNKAKNPPTPTSLWDQYKELGYNKFVEVVAAVGGGQTMGNTTMILGVVQAGYGIAAIRQQELIPGTAAHGRSDGAELRQWLGDNNFANLDSGGYDAKNSDARAVEAEMRNLMNDPDYFDEQLKRGIEAREKCLRELAAFKAAKANKKGK